jgi:hypothetical protein
LKLAVRLLALSIGYIDKSSLPPMYFQITKAKTAAPMMGGVICPPAEAATPPAKWPG